MARGFAIIRTKRITNINGAFNHNLRVSKEFSKHADHTKTDDNLILYDKFNFGLGGGNFEGRIDEHIKENNIFVKKGTNIKCMEFVLTASPEFFKTATDKEKLAWRKNQIDFLKEEFGKSLIHIVEHNDEKTKHIQAIILTDKTKLHKYKNQKGEFFKEKTTLSPGDYNPDYLRKLQDRYAEKNQKFGLVRGLRNSKATHRTLKNFYNAVEIAMSKDYSNAVRNKISSVLKADENMYGYIKTEKVIELLTPFLNDTLKKLKAVKTKLNFNTADIVTELNELLKDKDNIKELRKEYFESVSKYDEVKKENENLKEQLSVYSNKQKPQPQITSTVNIDKKLKIR
jgi:hypothetical protein